MSPIQIDVLGIFGGFVCEVSVLFIPLFLVLIRDLTLKKLPLVLLVKPIQTFKITEIKV